SRTPRSFLFAVVANVGPGGASRALAVAYRQHHDKYNNWEASGARLHHMVTDTLALIEILSDPANRAPLEAERALAEDWYRRSPHEPPVHERPSIPDTAQPPYVPCFENRVPVQQQPRLPWRDDALSQFPFTATCVLLALLRDDRPANATRPGDVQFQPLSTVFRADCTEYGLVVLDISDLDSGVQYGIAAFPVHYMATVWDPDENIDWDPVEDDQPEEWDIVLVSPRPRVPLSIAQWIRKYYRWSELEDHPGILRLEERPLADAAALDYEPISTARASSVTTSDEPPQKVPVDMDRTIDDLLVPFREKLRRRLKEMPDRLGPSIISSHVLRVAYTEHSHLNWVAFRSLPPCVIAAAVASDELRSASALSLCVDAWAGDKEEGASDLVDLAAALAQSTGLQQLCFLQRPDRDQDDVSSRFCSQLLRLWGRASGGEEKTIHSTSAFLTGLRHRKFPTSSLMIASGSSSFTPRIHLFTWLGPQREDIPDPAADHHVHSAYYSMENTGLTAEDFAVRFLKYLRSLGPDSDPDKAILRVAYHGAFSSLGSADDDNQEHRCKHGWSPRRPLSPPPLQSWPDQLGVRPIPAGFFDDELTLDDPSRVRLREIPPGAGWFLWIDEPAVTDAPKTAPSHNTVSSEFVDPLQRLNNNQDNKVVGGLIDFLRETVPETDIATWEERLEEVERDLVAALMRPSPPSTPSSIDWFPGMDPSEMLRNAPPKTDLSAGEGVERGPCIGVRVMAESRAYTLLDQLL
ncbi:hypothetical protein N7457_002234, partial [Penicillium paradoxum]|uniref:uncharacterized protein n=1 Tax=Penicillium paradoxum TaxID=176176 RepID=UPI002546EED2